MIEAENKILPLEVVTRYILSRRHYAPTAGRIKYNALMPKNNESSVYRIHDLSHDEIWSIGHNFVEKLSERTLYARGDLVASDVLETGLNIVPDTTQHPLHANIVGWPPEKPKKLILAKKLAQKAHLYENPI